MPEPITEAQLDGMVQRYREGIARTLVKSGFQAFLVGDLRAQLKIRKEMRNGRVRFANAEQKPRTAGRPRMQITFKGMSRQSAAYLKIYERDLVEKGGTVIKGKFVPWLADRSDRVRGSIAEQIRLGMEQGWSNETLGKALGEIMDQEGRAMTAIAHTEMARIEAAGARNRYHDLGIKKVIWNNGPTPCDICIEFSGNEYDLDDLPEEIPVHPICVLPGTRCETASEIVTGLRAWYDGEAVELTFANGCRLAVTPNHMLMTPHGFASAKLLCKGDHVFYRPGFERIIANDPDADNLPPRIEEVVGALAETCRVMARRVPAAPEDLHGDGNCIKGEVDVIGTYGSLGRGAIAPFGKHPSDDGLDPAHPGAVGLSGQGSLAAVLKGLALASDGGMSGLRVPSPLFRRRIGHAEEGCLACGSHDPAPLDQPLSQGPTGDLEDGDEFVHGTPGVVELTELVDIQLFEYHGYVFDLETDESVYICNTILVSNCACDLVPVIEIPPDEALLLEEDEIADMLAMIPATGATA